MELTMESFMLSVLFEPPFGEDRAGLMMRN
jgi:hypothetical protein